MTPHGSRDPAELATLLKLRAEPQDAAGSYLGAGVTSARAFLVVLVTICLLGLLLAVTVDRTLTRSIDRALVHLPGGEAPSQQPGARP